MTDDGLTQWQPAFLGLGKTLDECARTVSGVHLSGTNLKRNQQVCLPGEVDCWLVWKFTGKSFGSHPHQAEFSLSWQCQVLNPSEVLEVARKFIEANREEARELRSVM